MKVKKKKKEIKLDAKEGIKKMRLEGRQEGGNKNLKKTRKEGKEEEI